MGAGRTTMDCFESLDSAVKACFSEDITIEQMVPVSGGDINEALMIRLNDGSKVFMKRNWKENRSFFEAEAEGLAAIRSTGTIKTPKVYAIGTDGPHSFLLMEPADGARSGSGYYERFAERLARMHMADTSSFTNGMKFGFMHDNYIGASEQSNKLYPSWISFFRDERLRPQFERARSYFSDAEADAMEQLLSRLGELLREPIHPSLLHGDLWAGNYITGNDGEAWLIDPAVYVGHHEADLAMSELFGGFPREFYDAYRSLFSLESGYEERKDLYNLYHLLNHLNLFGGSYYYPVIRILHRFS